MQHRLTVIVAVLSVAIVGGYLWYRRGQPSPATVVTVTKRDLVETVSVTGRIKAAETIDLSFETAGRLATVSVDAGRTVRAGQVVAELSSADLKANVAEAAAALANARAKLAELQRGTRPEEVRVAETAVANARTSAADAAAALADVEQQGTVDLASRYAAVPDILNDAYAKADDAVEKQTDEFFTEDNTSPRLTFVTTDSQAQIEVERLRRELVATLAAFKAEAAAGSTDQASLDGALVRTFGYLATIRSFLVRLADTVNAPNSLSQSTATAYKGYLAIARANVNTSSASVNGQQQAILAKRAQNQSAVTAATAKVNDAASALRSAEDQLALKRAGPTPEAVLAAEAAVAQADASWQSSQVKLARSVLRSPVDGTVTKRLAAAGESVAASEPVFTMITDRTFELEANIPEVAIGKVRVGNPVAVTLDAFPDEQFPAKVTSIDPAETVVDGVVNFRVKASLDTRDDRLKSGLTANLEVEVDRRPGALALPEYAVSESNGRAFVRSVNGDSVIEATVTLGLRSRDGYVEIRSGVAEGQAVAGLTGAP